MASRRSNSWFEFFCEDRFKAFSENASVPPSMLEQFPEEVRSTNVIYLKDARWQVWPIPRVQELQQSDQLSLSAPRPPISHMGCPDLICHKWFQGICSYLTSCWNRHGFTFDAAMRSAVRLQQVLRGDPVPFAYDSSFRAFDDYSGCPEISMKPSKRQPPETQQRIQGVLMSSNESRRCANRWTVTSMPTTCHPMKPGRWPASATS